MRLCRYTQQNQTQAGLYDETSIVSLAAAAQAYSAATKDQVQLTAGDNLLDFLPHGTHAAAAAKVAAWAAQNRSALAAVSTSTSSVQLHMPIPRPNKLFLLAGNYAEHIREGGGIAAERAETFPYVFMKPPSTTLIDPGATVKIPQVSPGAIDWELELAVVIGQRCKHVKEADALKVVAGYAVINDISDRKFKPNPERKPRDRDKFFDWLHGKWHDSFCPMGPCIASADTIRDPQTMKMNLKLNGQIRQDASTSMMIFPVAAIIEFISSFVTLEPGDIISTGTPSGVGSTTGTFVKPGDKLEATIEQIGTLVSPVGAES